MKSSRINLVTAWQWLERELDERDLTATQQLTLFHLFIKINRNFWKPARISLNKLAVACSKDKRTIKKSLEELIELGLVVESEGGYFIGYGTAQTYSPVAKSVGRKVGEGNGNDTVGASDELDLDELKKQFG